MEEKFTGDPDCERLANDAMRDDPNEEPAMPRPRIYRTLRPVSECVWYLDEAELCRIRTDGSIVVAKHKFTPRQARALLSALLTHWLTLTQGEAAVTANDVLHALDMTL